MNSYLSNYRFGERLFNSIPKSNTSLIVVIPCHNEPDLISSLNALFSCQIPPSIAVEVIVVINAGFDAEEEIKNLNYSTLELATTWSQENRKENIDYLFYLNNDLPKKHAGVGLARKIGMDEAVDRFNQIKNIDTKLSQLGTDKQTLTGKLLKGVVDDSTYKIYSKQILALKKLMK